MQARGQLMIEHRFIERMLRVIGDEIQQIKLTKRVDSLLVDTVVDFIRIYADRTHHGKEEDILFRDLRKRPLSDGDQRIMEELIEEHSLGRQITNALFDANMLYRSGEKFALDEITHNFQALVDLYPRHIEKEDNVFFPAARSYFTDEEDMNMLTEFWDFDRKMIHEKYKSVVEKLLNKK